MSILIEILFVVLLGAIGNIFFKIGIEGFGELTIQSFFTKDFYIKAFTTKFGWIIFTSLVLFFIGRVLVMSPLSRAKFGIVFNLLAPLGAFATILTGFFIFHETYSIRELIGVGLAMVSVWLMGGGV